MNLEQIDTSTTAGKAIRLGKNQKALLAWVSGTCVEGSYACRTSHPPESLRFKFDYQEDLDRWLSKQVDKGLITTQLRGALVRITPFGQSLADKIRADLAGEKG